MTNASEITAVNVTLRDVMPKLLAIDDMAADDDRGTEYWYLGRGLLHIRVPNFGWRQRAIVRHDVHHILTGYPCTPTGEMQMAAWEFAAGRFPHPGATAFCLPLVGMGAVLSPRRTFAAFVRGRHGTSLYATPLSDEVLASRIVDLRQRFAPTVPTPATAGDWLTYLALVGLSFSLMLAPFLILAVAACACAR
jgi:hypothetical protein